MQGILHTQSLQVPQTVTHPPCCSWQEMVANTTAKRTLFGNKRLPDSVLTIFIDYLTQLAHTPQYFTKAIINIEVYRTQGPHPKQDCQDVTGKTKDKAQVFPNHRGSSKNHIQWLKNSSHMSQSFTSTSSTRVHKASLPLSKLLATKHVMQQTLLKELKR